MNVEVKRRGRKANHDGWICKKCNLIFRTRAELRLHNKNTKHKNNQGWSKGLTKETDERIAKNAISVSRSMKAGYSSGRLIFTQERKDHLSKVRKEFLQLHPEKHPSRLVCNTKNHMTYPEQIVYDWLVQNNFEFESQFQWTYFQKDGSKHIRYVDFALPNKKIFIEVDGNFWHKNLKEIDQIKDKCAKDDGFKTLRIDPSKSIVQQLSIFFTLY